MSIQPIDDFPGGGGGSALNILTNSLLVGNVGAYYFDFLDASGGYSPYDWSLSSGTLPVGLTLNSNGQISGTPTASGTSLFVVRVTDQVGGTKIKSLSIQIDTSSEPIITTTTLPPVQLGNTYSEQLEVTGGVSPYTWTLDTGSLPTGLTISSTGLISGTATVAGIYSFTVEVEDSDTNIDIQSLNIVVQAPSPTIITTSLPDAVVGSSYSALIEAIGGTTPYVNWIISINSLPNGLNITSSPTTATISGIPTTPGTYNFTVQVEDTATGIDTQVFTLIVNSNTIPIISTTVLPFAPLNEPYSQNLNASGGALPYTWTLDSNILPNGLTLSTSGLISGTPTVNGSFVFTVKVTDAYGKFDYQLLSIIVGTSILPAIITNELPNGIENSLYSTFIQGNGGELPYSWSLLGTLPIGLTLDTNGQISGIPTTSGLYNFQILLSDNNLDLDLQSYSIFIQDSTLPVILTTELESSQLDVYYTKSIFATGGVPSYTWTIDDGVLPNGLTISNFGIITGTPTQVGLYNFDVKIVDSNSNEFIQSYQLVVRSTGYNSSCCFCVFTNQIVDFTTNGFNGILTATGGTILTNSKWQAPSIEGIYNITITVDGSNGEISSNNTINVIKKLELINTTSLISDLLPGEEFQIETNYPNHLVNWQTLDNDFPIVTPSGLIIINTNAADNCFGSLNCTIRGTLQGIEDCNIESYVDIKIKVNPVFPTPKFCGPELLKWMREARDFRVIKTEFEGGCDETHIRNKVPILRWTINYDGLVKYNAIENECPNCTRCVAYCGCDDGNELDYNGCHPLLKSANRLDDFWNLVYGEYNSFTLVDHDTDEVWYNVKFEDKMTLDHRHRRRSNARSVKLVWKPCCDREPTGGTCSKHGMKNYIPVGKTEDKCDLSLFRKVEDVFLSYKLKGTYTFNSTTLYWTNINSYSVTGYYIKINGGQYFDHIIDVGNVNEFTINGLEGDTTYYYQILAYGSNQSIRFHWSPTFILRTLPTPVNELIAPTVPLITSLQATNDELYIQWTESNDNIVVEPLEDVSPSIPQNVNLTVIGDNSLLVEWDYAEDYITPIEEDDIFLLLI